MPSVLGEDTATADGRAHSRARNRPDRRRRAPTRVRYGLRLAADITAYAAINRIWWIVPLSLALLAAALLIVVGQAAAPVTLYPVF